MAPGDHEQQVSLPCKRRAIAIEQDSSATCTSPRFLGEEEDDEHIYGASHFGAFGEYMQRKRAKLQIQNAALAQSNAVENSGIFKGLSIHINGWTQPSVQDLRQLIVQNGGVFQPYLDKKTLVTHIITCSLTPTKVHEFKSMKVARPEWIVHSVKQGRLLPWHDYKYSPEDRTESAQGKRVGQTTLSAFTPKDGKPLHAESTSFQLTNTSDRDSPLPYAAGISNPVAEKALADPEWRRAHTSAASDFVEGYYRNSRLHYLSTWKSELRALIAEAQGKVEPGKQAETCHNVAKSSAEVSQDSSASTSMRGADIGLLRSPSKSTLSMIPERAMEGRSKAIDPINFLHGQKVLSSSQRVIMHCDFDCFFVSVGLITRPHLRGKPVVVCHSQGTRGGVSSTSDVASASYEAREKGVQNGMSLQQARKLCPNVMTMPYEFERYKQLSLQFYRILLSHADDLQAVSVDEALIDVTSAVRELGDKYLSSAGSQASGRDPAKELAEDIRTQVRHATGCEISIGISHNILLARLATRRAKPAGSYHLTNSTGKPDAILQFLSHLDISDLPGFGYAAKNKALENVGSSKVTSLREIRKERLCEVFGRTTGETLWGFVRGIDDRLLERDGGRRSVSCEINYGIRFENDEQVERFISQMAKEMKRRLDDINMLGRSLTLKIMKRDMAAPIEPPKFLGHGQCDVFTKQIQLIGPGGQATNDDQVIAQHATRLLKSFRFDPKELRGIGMHLQRLEPPTGKGKASTKTRSFGQAVLSFPKAQPSSNHDCTASVSGLASSDKAKHTRLTGFDLQGIVSDPAVDENTRCASYREHSTAQDISAGEFNALAEDAEKELDIALELCSPSPRSAPLRPQTSILRMPGKQCSDNEARNLQRVVQQIAPRPSRNVDRMLKPKSVSTRVSEAELVSLGLDPEVFFSLPERVQREQLVRCRLFREGGKLLDGPTQKKVLKPQNPLTVSVDRRRQKAAPNAKYKEPLFLRQHSRQGEKSQLTETQDIQKAIGNWVERYRHWRRM
ncbi:hypothetical protein AX17_001947 [Amanita inopinata Kibby_2008]|nr:hypothetical protein AX17_001947 [Amanita inopinata Kibby_2008]